MYTYIMYSSYRFGASGKLNSRNVTTAVYAIMLGGILKIYEGMCEFTRVKSHTPVHSVLIDLLEIPILVHIFVPDTCIS